MTMFALELLLPPMSFVLQANNVSAGAGPGSYSLPDILRLGEGGQSWIEYQAQVTMYAVMGTAFISGTLELAACCSMAALKLV